MSRPSRFSNRNAWLPPSDTTKRPITAASISRPPNRLYSRNFTAAYERCAPPYEPMMKYIGTSIASNRT